MADDPPQPFSAPQLAAMQAAIAEAIANVAPQQQHDGADAAEGAAGGAAGVGGVAGVGGAVAAAAVAAIAPALAGISAAAVKLPPFLLAKPRTWFRQAEAQFQVKNVTLDNTRYYHVLAALDQATQERMAAILDAVPAQGKYDYLKAAALKIYGQTAEADANRFLNLAAQPGLGDKTPSAMLAAMRAMHNTDDVFRQNFLRQLPDAVRGQLDGDKGLSLEELADKADLVMAGFRAAKPGLVPGVSAMQSGGRGGSSGGRGGRGGRGGSSSGRGGRGGASSSGGGSTVARGETEEVQDGPPSMIGANRPNGICHAHNKFGAAAFRCFVPCKWKQQQRSTVAALDYDGSEAMASGNC